MAKGQHHIVNSKDYQRYLEDKMTPKERHDFEQIMLESEFENEAFEGLSQLQGHEISSDLNDLHENLNARIHKRNPNAYWRIAAAIVLLAAFSFSIYFLIDSDSTSEIVQHKKIPVKQEVNMEEESAATLEDSIDYEQESVIAYQQEIEKEEEKPIAKSIQLPAAKGEVTSETDGISDAEPEEEIIEEQVQLKEVAPMELPDLAYEENTEIKEMPIEEALTGRVAGVTIKSSSARRKRSTSLESTRTITGKVRSEEDDEVLPGVKVIVKGTNIGAVSDIEGNYSVDVPNDAEVVLVFAYVGFTSEEIVVGDQEEINIIIEPDLTSLSEIVVTGYATQKRSNITGAVSSVEIDDHENRAYRYDPPQPVGGNGNFKDHVKENIKYPASGLEDNIKGTVKLKFTVERNGSISNIEVLKSLSKDFDEEAIRLVKSGPTWEPAKENDATVAKEVKVKIRFRPPN